MNSRLALLIVLALPTSVDLLALQGRSPAIERRKEPVSCWLGEPEIKNLNPGKHRPIRLPPERANAKLQRTVMLLRLCVSEAGDVARVLVLESSGNPDVDRYYATELSRRTFAPAERAKKRVRSVVPVTITLHIK